MEFITKPPEWLTNQLPEGAKSFLENGGWYGVLGFFALVILLLVWAILSRMGSLFEARKKEPKEDLTEDLAALPAAAPSTGDRRLTIDGVPVRVRLVVVAPTGETELSSRQAFNLLDKVVTGLGDVASNDKPRIRVWSKQLSYEGFANTFHRSTPIPEGERKPSRWVLVAGRAKAGSDQIMIGLGLQAIKPTTLGRRTLKAHEWAETFRIKVRE